MSLFDVRVIYSCCNYIYAFFFIIVDLLSVSLAARDNGIQTINSAKSLIEVTDSLEETLFSHSFPIFSSRSTRHGSTRERRIRRFVWQRIKLLYKNVKGFASANRFRGLRGSKRSRMWARLVRWNRRIANAIGSLIVSKSGAEGGVRRVETWDPTREFKASRGNSGNSGREEE